jgi:hypothetical protein
MKRIVILLVAIVAMAVTTGCKKESYTNSLIGTWELRASSGSMTPEKIYLPGNGTRLRFTADSYEIYQDNQFVRGGQYQVVKDGNVSVTVCLQFDSNRFTERIVYDNDVLRPSPYFEIKDDVLTLIAGCYALDGGHSERYVKIHNGGN